MTKNELIYSTEYESVVKINFKTVFLLKNSSLLHDLKIMSEWEVMDFSPLQKSAIFGIKDVNLTGNLIPVEGIREIRLKQIRNGKPP